MTTITGLYNQNKIVVENLMLLNKFDRYTAMKLWYNSKTKKQLEENKMFWVDGTHCYYELLLELSNSSEF